MCPQLALDPMKLSYQANGGLQRGVAREKRLTGHRSAYIRRVIVAAAPHGGERLDSVAARRPHRASIHAEQRIVSSSIDCLPVVARGPYTPAAAVCDRPALQAMATAALPR